MKHLKLLGALMLGVLGIVPSAISADFSFTGNFSTNEDVQLFTFTLGAPASVTLKTLGYSGGTNAAGSLIPAGGFDPILTLFSGTGPGASFVTENDDGGPGFDSLLTPALGVGTYTLALTMFSNFANQPTLGDGFDGSGTGTPFGGRTSAWAVDILTVDSASAGDAAGVPDAGSTLALLSVALSALMVLRRRLCSV